ncbi:hypothetical protein AXW41_07195 [Yersinia ruckeri]|uniref:hypothetical protein n=1 Tax=Yersinia ruckeri TaxID=29486 RepID=UPI0004E2A17C|nr:hypothetical protein [Yersinia ruckeri]ARZ00771.1 hypothetical protein QMA0440_01431 [Yersinia ruckeri]EKN4181117.1 hypothetical protein [Yersinia ruckeri]KFE38717.1 hypothetical protein nADLYRO1b_1982 [Yersinia ruckeri]MCK8553806.1 hypothetical protein [Yersinia ruckeri]MCW6608435.1 hypothetical protein [Yersinia ruckeri]
MALPHEYRNEQVNELERELHKYEIADLDNLSKEDFCLLGMYIQTYNFIELNIQRIFIQLLDAEVICLIQKGKKTKKVDFHFMIEKLKSSLSEIEPNLNDRMEVIDRLNEIVYRRSHRNIIAHWAGKKIPGKDAFVFFTSDLEDMKRVKKIKKEGDFIVTPGVVNYQIINAADLRGLFTHINEYEVWIAHKAAEWIEKFNNPEILIDKSTV